MREKITESDVQAALAYKRHASSARCPKQGQRNILLGGRNLFFSRKCITFQCRPESMRHFFKKKGVYAYRASQNTKEHPPFRRSRLASFSLVKWSYTHISHFPTNKCLKKSNSYPQIFASTSRPYTPSLLPQAVAR